MDSSSNSRQRKIYFSSNDLQSIWVPDEKIPTNICSVGILFPWWFGVVVVQDAGENARLLHLMGNIWDEMLICCLLLFSN